MSENSNDYLTPAQAARLCPVKISPEGVWRWMRKGVLARDGTRVFLRHIRIGRRVFTRKEWLDEHWAELAAADQKAAGAASDAGPSSRPKRQRKRRGGDERADAIVKADQELREAGV